MYDYLAKINEIKDAEPYSKQYKVYSVECPFCGYTCEVHAVSELRIHTLVARCHVCKKRLKKAKVY